MVLAMRLRWSAATVVGLLFVTAGFGAGCAAKQSMVVLETSEPIHIAWILDRHGDMPPEVMPDTAIATIAQSLTERNLQPQAIAVAEQQHALAQMRGSLARLNLVAGDGEGALTTGSWVMLVETQAEYYAQLEGRFRWVVAVQVGLGRTGQLERAALHGFEVPVFLPFVHQKEAEAIEAAAPVIAHRLGQILDEALGAWQVMSGEASDGGGDGTGHDIEDSDGGSDAGTWMGWPAGRHTGIYLAMVDRFQNGDPTNDVGVDRSDPEAFHGGDLQGVIDGLDHLQGLGVTHLWITPVNPTRSDPFFGHGAYHGYWITDVVGVDARYGGEVALHALREALAERGMGLVIDLVTNHVAPGSAWTSEHPQWFGKRGPINDWDNEEERVWGEVHGLPDLDQNHPAVRTKLLAAARWWVETFSPEMVRIDAVRHLPRDFVADLTATLRTADPRVEVIGEVFEGDPVRLSEAWGAGGFSAVFDFPLHYALVDAFCADQPAGRIGAVLSLDRMYPDPNALVTFLDNHDRPRLLGACGGDHRKASAALEALLALRGQPTVTWGTETDADGIEEPNNRADLRPGTKGALGITIAEGFARRFGSGALTYGVSRLLAADRDHLLVARYVEHQVALVAINGGTGTWEVTDEMVGNDVLGLLGEVEVDGDEGSAGGGRWLVDPGVTVRVFDVEELPQVLAAASGLRMVRFDAGGIEADKLFAVGSAPELGAWDADAGLPMERSYDGRWRGEIELPEDGLVAWKLVAVRGTQVVWEEVADRYLWVPRGSGSVVVPALWGG